MVHQLPNNLSWTFLWWQFFGLSFRSKVNVISRPLYSYIYSFTSIKIEMKIYLFIFWQRYCVFKDQDIFFFWSRRLPNKADSLVFSWLPILMCPYVTSVQTCRHQSDPGSLGRCSIRIYLGFVYLSYMMSAFTVMSETNLVSVSASNIYADL